MHKVHSLDLIWDDLVMSYVNNNKDEGGAAMTDFREISKTRLHRTGWRYSFY